jgi:tripartite-type tricarboxylate transporter receptor subunit TctC
MRGMLFSVLMAFSSALASSNADAQDYPTRLVRLVVPQAAGGTTDVLARAIGNRLSKKWGQSVIVENRAGAAGNIGTDSVAKAAPDGYTLLVTYEGSQAINVSLYPNTPFDPVKDFQPVATFAVAPFYVIAGPKLPVNNLRDLITLARTKAGGITYATSGIGSVNHLIAEMINTQAGIKMVHVPHRGIAQAITNIMGGQVEAGVSAVPSVISQVKSGDIKALAVTSAQRTAITPDVPTVAEAGLSGFDVNPWWGMLAPAGTDTSIVRKINADIAEILRDPAMKDFLALQGAEPFITAPEDFRALLVRNVATWTKVVKEAGVRVD